MKCLLLNYTTLIDLYNICITCIVYVLHKNSLNTWKSPSTPSLLQVKLWCSQFFVQIPWINNGKIYHQSILQVNFEEGGTNYLKIMTILRVLYISNYVVILQLTEYFGFFVFLYFIIFKANFYETEGCSCYGTIQDETMQMTLIISSYLMNASPKSH